MTTPKSFDVTTSSGVRLSCAEQGDPAGPALLLVHGYGDSWRSFGPLMAALPQTYRMVAVTLRGHGDSGKPDAGYTLADFAGDLPAVLDHCGIQGAIVVGHSMGSFIAQRFTLDHPESVRALVLIGALSTLKDNVAVGDMWDAVLAPMTDPVDPAFVREFQEGTLARPVAPAFWDTIISESFKLPARTWRDAFRGMLDADLTPDLHRIAVPTLIVWGDKDSICDRAMQKLLVTSIPGARLEIYEGNGHAPHWEDPERVAADLATFLGRAELAAD